MPDQTQHDNSSATIVWNCGEVSLQSLGGMLGPVTFRLPGGKKVRPLHIAPWENEDLSDQPPILQRLRGEWLCVPFGMRPNEQLPELWQGVDGSEHCDPAGAYPHGFGSNHHWRISAPEPLVLTGEIGYPETSAIARLRRTIIATPDKPELTIELAISARSRCSLPIGLHPVFALPNRPGAMRFDAGEYDAVWTHPLDEHPGLSIFEPGKIFADLSQAPRRDGSVINACSLPFGSPSESLLLLTHTAGSVGLVNTVENYRTELEWDPQVFPSLMLWISNRGRQARPWLGRHLAIGIEPVRAAFDLGQSVSASSNPLSRVGIPTVWHFGAGETLVTRYAIRVSKAV